MIVKESLNAGFMKYHLNQSGEEGWPIRPVIHQFTQPDGGHPHDHPFDIDIYVLMNGYIEEIYDPVTWRMITVERKQGDHFILPATRIHKIGTLLGECWTLAMYGPKVKEPRFWRHEGGRVESRAWNEHIWS